MKRLTYGALTLAPATVGLAADHPDFTGNWRIDASKAADGKGPSPQPPNKVVFLKQ
jgi:hypothetical protein